jgi:hypothetical protein
MEDGRRKWEEHDGVSMVEFTNLMKQDAEEQKEMVGIVAGLVAQLVDDNDQVRRGKWGPPYLLGFRPGVE